MKEAIQKAIEGGWNQGYKISHYGVMGDVLLVKGVRSRALIEAEIREDLLFWQALGKAMGWDGKPFGISIPNGGETVVHKTKDEWKNNWHRFTDHLAEGKDVESFFNELLK